MMVMPDPTPESILEDVRKLRRASGKLTAAHAALASAGLDGFGDALRRLRYDCENAEHGYARALQSLMVSIEVYDGQREYAARRGAAPGAGDPPEATR